MELTLAELKIFRKSIHPELMKFKRYEPDVEMSLNLKDNIKICLVKRISDGVETIDVTLVKDNKLSKSLLSFCNKNKSKVPMAFLNLEIWTQLRQLMFHQLCLDGKIKKLDRDIYKEYLEAGSPVNGESFQLLNGIKTQYMNGYGLLSHEPAFIM